MSDDLIARIEDGRTDLVFEAVGADQSSLMQTCAYFGDVSAIRFLLSQGATLHMLGDNYGLNGAAFHGHWRLCQFLIERGANTNEALPDTGETPLHACLCTTERSAHDRVMQVLLAGGANPNVATIPGVETGGFMRDCRTKGETPLHRAAAFGTANTIQMLLNSGATVEGKDTNGDTPLSWGSWYARPADVLRLLCYGPYHIRPDYRGMKENLLGDA